MVAHLERRELERGGELGLEDLAHAVAALGALAAGLERAREPPKLELRERLRRAAVWRCAAWQRAVRDAAGARARRRAIARHSHVAGGSAVACVDLLVVLHHRPRVELLGRSVRVRWLAAEARRTPEDLGVAETRGEEVVGRHPAGCAEQREARVPVAHPKHAQRQLVRWAGVQRQPPVDQAQPDAQLHLRVVRATQERANERGTAQMRVLPVLARVGKQAVACRLRRRVQLARVVAKVAHQPLQRQPALEHRLWQRRPAATAAHPATAAGARRRARRASLAAATGATDCRAADAALSPAAATSCGAAAVA